MKLASAEGAQAPIHIQSQRTSGSKPRPVYKKAPTLGASNLPKEGVAISNSNSRGTKSNQQTSALQPQIHNNSVLQESKQGDHHLQANRYNREGDIFTPKEDVISQCL